MASPDSTKEVVTLRMPRRDMQAVREIAAREDETASVIIRRLVRSALTLQQSEAAR